MARPRGKYWQWAPTPQERIPPFLLTRQDDGNTVLITPFAKRRGGLTSEEAAQVQTVAEHLRNLAPARGSVWIDVHTGAATAAAIGEGQLRRRLIDCASFNVRIG